jgi:hypothetical protein
MECASGQFHSALDAFAKLRKLTTGSVMSFCLSLRLEHPGFRWTDFHEIWYVFRKSIKIVQILLKSDKKNGYFAQIPVYIYDNISLTFLRMGNVSEKKT